MKQVNTILLLICCGLYILNITIFKRIEGVFQNFFICWFNDLIAPIFALAYLNLRCLGGFTFYTPLRIIVLCTVFSIVWELIGQYIKPNSVTDPIDVACYYLGGLLYFYIIKIEKSIESKKRK